MYRRWWTLTGVSARIVSGEFMMTGPRVMKVTVPPSATLGRMRKQPQQEVEPKAQPIIPQPHPQTRSTSPSEDSIESPAESRKKNTMDEAARKKKLESDRWATEVTPKSVGCKACGRTVSLDKRSRYYPGLWLKHRGKCMEVKRLEAAQDVKVMSRSTMSRMGKH